MANNELVTIEPAITVNPTPIVINNREQVEKAVEAFVAKYGQDFVVTADNLTDTKHMRAELNKVAKLIDDSRKDAKKQYLVPLTAFEKVINGYRDQIRDIVDPLKVKIDEVEELDRQRRLDDVKRIIAEMAPNYGVPASDIPVRSSWLNKSASGKKVTEEIAADMTQLKKDNDQRATDIQTIRTYADQLELESSGWAALIGKDESVTDIMADMDQAAAQRDERRLYDAERAKAAKEAQDAIDATHQVKKDGETVDTDTGEVVPQTISIKLTGTHKQLAQAWSGIKQLGIEVEMLKED